MVETMEEYMYLSISLFLSLPLSVNGHSCINFIVKLYKDDPKSKQKAEEEGPVDKHKFPKSQKVPQQCRKKNMIKFFKNLLISIYIVVFNF